MESNRKNKPIGQNVFHLQTKMNSFHKILLILIFIAGSGLLVYATGGIKYVYSHTMYIPIILAAYFFNVPGGILVGVIAGLVLGPLMPLNVETGEMQSTVNWMYRTGIFTILGAITGHIFSLTKKQVKEMRRMMFYDRETGLPNRSHLYVDLDKMAKEDSRESQFALFVILVDNHAQITRILEMEELNSLNAKVSARLKYVLEDSEKVYQLFPYLLCIVMKADEGEDFCRAIVESIYNELQMPFEINRVPVFLNVSIGIAIEHLQHISSTFFVQKGIVAALIASEKEMKYWIYKQEEFSAVRNSQMLLGDVSGGIEHNEFELYYQPIVNLVDGKTKGVEALLRWHHRKFGMVPPMSFLPILEHTSLLYSVHDWVLEEAIGQLMEWHNYSEKMAINLSTRLLLDHSWIQKYENLLKTFMVDPSRIVFEITETAIMKDVDKSNTALSRLKAMGSMVALDDFGTGYSSLEYIQMLPIDYMKIDQRFITNVSNQPKNQKITKTAISLAKSIGVETVAEGIEKQADYDWLVSENCRYGQGFLIGKPMPGEKLAKWIKNREQEGNKALL